MQIVLPYALASDEETQDNNLYIALVGPMSGQDQSKGREMADAANFYIDKVNAQGGINGKKVKLLIFDDRNDSATATQKALEIAADDKILLVIGHRNSAASIAGGKIYKEKSIPAITATATAENVTKDNEWYFRVIFNNEQQGKFIANYVYHVLNHKIASIIYDQDAYGSGLAQFFEKATQSLGMTVNYKWSLDTGSMELLMQLKDCIDELSQKRNAGVVLLAVHTREAVTLIKAMKDMGMNLPLFGGDSIGKQTFPAHFQDFQMEQSNPGFYSDDIYTSSYFISDTMGHFAERVNDEFKAKFKRAPNAAEMAYYDAVALGLEAIKQTRVTGENPFGDREQIRAFWAGINSVRNAFKGVTGYIYFDKKGDAQQNVPIGVFKNTRLISAPVQLNPIASLTEIEAVKRNLSAQGENPAEFLSFKGIVLIDGTYVQKTFLVYTGMEPVEISKPDFGKSEFDMDFFLWFRYQRGIQPQRIEFLNAVEPIKLEKPIDEKTSGDHIIYRKYRVKGRFKSNFLALPPDLDQHILGTAFRHVNLTQNQLTYIVDVLGMPEYTGQDKKIQTRFLSPTFGYTVSRLRFSKAILEKKGMGSPRHLGAKKGKVKYSRFNMAIYIKKTQMTLRRIIKNGPLNYALLMISLSFIVIIELDSRTKKFSNFLKTMLIAEVFLTVLFLISGEIMLLGLLTGKAGIDILEIIKLIFDVLWWLAPAYFLNKIIKELILSPTAAHLERNVPSLLLYFISFIIYLLAFFGIIAFVFDQKLTSLLATSGVLAMIIGLAIQINISNIFSGIAINLERTFRIGDWVTIGSHSGQVLDITWRTTKIHELGGNIISIPNSVASESVTINYDYPDDTYKLAFKFETVDSYSPERVIQITKDALLDTEGVLKDPEPIVFFQGQGDSSAIFDVRFTTRDYGKKNMHLSECWKSVWKHLAKEGIELATPHRVLHLIQEDSAVSSTGSAKA
jgi:branched-chain amino acid transport system substrate-binding protein